MKKVDVIRLNLVEKNCVICGRKVMAMVRERDPRCPVHIDVRAKR